MTGVQTCALPICTHEKEGKEILKNSGLPIISAESLGDAAKKAVELAAEK